ncbi:MAG: RecX family transcriptional regulator [Anaerolineae bacterium]|nr:RecX family transcriptional regulator [Anaerolineae bacterium]MBN8618510.1 RecX family transcriptional regulator [Anaerolineae bacterium]
MDKGVITALEVQKRNKERVNVFIDGEYAFGLSLMEAARLKKGQVLSAGEIARLKGEDAVVQAVESAAHFLSYRPRSLQEVRRNLKEKELPPEVTEAAVERLTALGYLDDEAFARYWVQNRAEFKPLSHRALRQELRQKGIADSIINEVLAGQDEQGLAYEAAQGQLRRLRQKTLREFKTKMSAFLQRRGFSYSTTQDVVVRIIEEMEAGDPDYFNRAIDNED